MWIADTALRRRGVAGLRRNVAVAIGHSGAADGGDVLADSLSDSLAARQAAVRILERSAFLPIDRAEAALLRPMSLIGRARSSTS